MGENKKILCVLHQAHSTTARIGRLLREQGYEIIKCRHALGEPLPSNCQDYAGIVVFGGPMSANDTHLDFIKNEIDWIASGKPLEVPFLGVCLGAQLLARAMGGTVHPHPEGVKEIGYHKINMTTDGQDLLGLTDTHVFQWHSEGVQLGESGQTLAYSQHFDNQMFVAGKHIWGVQFHLEMFAELMERWYARAKPNLNIAGTHDVHLSREGSREWLGPNEDLLKQVVHEWLHSESK